MDSIDIIDPAFSLDSNDIIGESKTSLIPDFGIEKYNYNLIYIGIAAILFLVGLFVFKYYQNRKNNNINKNNLDCEGGFCTINQSQQ